MVVTKFNFPRSALLIIDVQNDFCPGGSLEVKNGDEVISPLNRLSTLFAEKSGRVIATQDWHPANHVSFAASPGGWPVHCVQGTKEADFHAALDLIPVNLVIRKGFHVSLDSYSAFFENDRKTSTGLDGYLKALSIDTLVLGGLAADYCVLYSALDAVNLGYKTIVALDAVRGVEEGTTERAFTHLHEAGVILAESAEIQ
jgi:nicotinamidase/pyrazinamidase